MIIHLGGYSNFSAINAKRKLIEHKKYCDYCEYRIDNQKIADDRLSKSLKGTSLLYIFFSIKI